MSLFTHTRGTGPRLVLAHGFSQNTRCWGPLADDLASRHQVVLVDAPGHGQSDHDDADLWSAGRLLGEAGGDGVYVGYSMGARAALHTALAWPDVVQRLVLIGATAGLDTEAERAARRLADGALARRLLDDGLPAFIDAWLAGPLFATLPPAATCRAERLSNRPAGLAASLERCGTGTQEPLWDRLPELAMPVLVLAGADDPRFSALGQRLVGCIGPNAALVVQPGANHAVHLERPHEVAGLIAAFAAR